MKKMSNYLERISNLSVKNNKVIEELQKSMLMSNNDEVKDLCRS